MFTPLQVSPAVDVSIVDEADRELEDFRDLVLRYEQARQQQTDAQLAEQVRTLAYWAV